MLKLTLQKKLLVFSIILALIPIGTAGRFVIKKTRDEVKSFLNDELIVTADQLVKDIDNLYTHTWLASLMMMKPVVEHKELGPAEKISVLVNIKNVSDIVSLQISIEGTSSPIVLTQDTYTLRMSKNGIENPIDMLTLPIEKIQSLQNQTSPDGNGIFAGDLKYIHEIDSWLISVVIPLKDISGRRVSMCARISLDRLRKQIEEHPFYKSGNIILADRKCRRIFDPEQSDLSMYTVINNAKNLSQADIRTTGVTLYKTPSGKEMLAGYTFSQAFGWVIVVEKDASKAYLAVTSMTRSLLLMALFGVIIAGIGAVVFSKRISNPILEIGKVVCAVGKGDFSVRVKHLKSHDEISDLGQRINEMIEGLRERFQLRKFVSGQTIKAIKKSDNEGIKLGGERKTATVFFSDIRGFTAFSEKYEPEVVISMLNTYLKVQAEIVRKYRGDIDKFVGDELVAVFQGKNMVKNAVLCAREIHRNVDELNKKHNEWRDIHVGIGINTGVMVMGAMGSEDRMDYTILGDNVNLGARLCSHAKAGETVLSKSAWKYLNSSVNNEPGFPEIIKGEQVQVKGKAEPIQVYRVGDYQKKGNIDEE